MEKFLVGNGVGNPLKSGTYKRPANEPRPVGLNHPKAKITKKPVGKEATIRAWGLDWIKISRTEGGRGELTISCIACQSQYRAKCSKGAISNDPFLRGTTNTKKSSAFRHQESVNHKSAYSKSPKILQMKYMRLGLALC